MPGAMKGKRSREPATSSMSSSSSGVVHGVVCDINHQHACALTRSCPLKLIRVVEVADFSYFSGCRVLAIAVAIAAVVVVVGAH